MKEQTVGFTRRVADDQPKIVLAALDDAALRNQVSNVCDKHQYTFFSAASSGEATKLMQQIAPNVVILRLTTGESDVVEWQRHHHLASSLLIMRSNLDEAVEAIKAGATDILVAPLPDDQLQSAIERALLVNRTKAYDFAALDKKNRVKRGL
jgi:DNA-binding NtrC family response regulator